MVEFDSGRIKMAIGLGNPGGAYRNTYHNVGLLFLNYLIKNQRSFDFSAPSPHRRSGQFSIFRSNTHMNDSGMFVEKILEKHKVEPEELLVVHDDSDIEVGKFKFSFGRNSAGHKGVESIIKALDTKDFWRLRIGIRPKALPANAGKPRPARRGGKAGEFVLKKISAEDEKFLLFVYGKAAEALRNKP